MVRNEVSLLACLRRPDQVGTVIQRHKYLLILLLSLLVMQPGLWALAHNGVPAWACIVIWPSFWMGGQLFVVAMIGNGKDGLGIKRD